MVPSLVTKGKWGLPEEQLEQFVIIMLGSLGFFLFVLQRKKVLLHIKEKAHFIRETNRMSKDLATSYSYIGEINRKLDILKNIALGLPEAASFTSKKEREVFNLILDAIRVLGKSNSFAIRFMRMSDGKMLREITSHKNLKLKCPVKECLHKKHIVETASYAVITSH